MKLFVTLLSALLITACGSKSPTPEPTKAEPTKAETTPEPTKAEATTAPTADAPDVVAANTPAPLTPPQKAWAELTPEEKGKHMKEFVNPAMKERFQAFDPVHYEKFGCMTCHGAKARDVKFKMPNPDLPKLANSEEGYKAWMAKATDKQKATSEFMMKTVLPDMATLLGQKPFDPATGKGFSCMNCHTPEG